MKLQVRLVACANYWRPLTGTAPVSRENVAQNTHQQSAYEYKSFIFVTKVTQLIHDAGKYLLISVYPLPTHPTHNFTHKNGGNLETLPGLPKKLDHNRPARCAGQWPRMTSVIVYRPDPPTILPFQNRAEASISYNRSRLTPDWGPHLLGGPNLLGGTHGPRTRYGVPNTINLHWHTYGVILKT